jgi:hypothetical protein
MEITLAGKLLYHRLENCHVDFVFDIPDTIEDGVVLTFDPLKLYEKPSTIEMYGIMRLSLQCVGPGTQGMRLIIKE